MHVGAALKFVENQWKPGQSGNPAGRPKGSRHKFEEAFVADFLESWLKSGKSVIEKVIEDNPVAYLKVASIILPKHVVDVGDSFDRNAIQRALGVIEQRILAGDAGSAPKGGPGTSGAG